MFTKVLRAGEGKKVRRLAELVPLVNALEPEMEARSDEELRSMTPLFRQRLENELSLMHSRMWHFQLRLVNVAIAKIQQVDVDLA